MKLGESFYNALKKNNTATWVVGQVASVCIIGAFWFSISVYRDSTNNIFAINEKGELVPLKKIEIQQANLIQAKANLEYFVENYYNLDAYSMKRKREKVLWLVGDQPTKIVKDRARKAYFDDFLTIAGLIQRAEILQHTLKITKEAPYEAEFIVRIQRVNGGVSEYYDSYVKLTMENVNRNYPYNPYGLLITQFSESLKRVDITTDEAKAEEEQSEEAINQNPKEKIENGNGE